MGRIAVCAEAIALGRAATEAGDTDIDTLVAVAHPDASSPDQSIHVVPPCGMCREMIADYSPTARVIVPDGEKLLTVVTILELLPHRYGTRTP